MTLNTPAVAQQLVVVLQGLSGMGAVQIGVPESTGPRVSAYVTAAGQALARQATGTTRRDARYNVTLAYRVDNAEATAETTLMGLLDAFIAAVEADLTLAGTCQAAELDLSLADTPEYQLRAGREYREFPIIVTARQYGAFTPNP